MESGIENRIADRYANGAVRTTGAMVALRPARAGAIETLKTWRTTQTIGAIVAIAACGSAWAETPAATEAGTACVEVEVNGARAPSYPCLTQKLAPADADRQDRSNTLGSEAIIDRSPNQLGLYNRAATEHRMGNAFGNSVRPQRPDSPANGAPVVPLPAPR